MRRLLIFQRQAESSLCLGCSWEQSRAELFWVPSAEGPPTLGCPWPSSPQESGCGLMSLQRGCVHSVKIPSLFKMSDKPLLVFPSHAESPLPPSHPVLSQLFPLEMKRKHSNSVGRCFSVECTVLISWYVPLLHPGWACFLWLIIRMVIVCM